MKNINLTKKLTIHYYLYYYVLSVGSVQLLRAIDSFKDQTYFLSTVSQVYMDTTYTYMYNTVEPMYV